MAQLHSQPSLQPAPTAPLCRADSGKTKGRADNPDEYLTVTGFMSPSLLQIECLTLMTSGREHTHPGLEQGEQAPGQGGGTVPWSLMPPAQPPPSSCRAWLEEQLLPAQTHLLWVDALSLIFHVFQILCCPGMQF